MSTKRLAKVYSVSTLLLNTALTHRFHPSLWSTPDIASPPGVE